MRFIKSPIQSFRYFLRRYWPQLILLAVSSLLSFAMGEFLFRRMVHWNYQRRVAAYHDAFWLPVPDRPEEIFRLHPDAQGVGHLPEKKEVAWNYVLNHEGFRGRALKPKRPGVTRIVCLGDSYTFGWAMNQREDPYPAVMEKILNRDASTTRVEVFNLGLPGYNTRMETALLRAEADRYRPDIVVTALVMNDAEPPGYEVPSPPQTRYRFCRSWLVAKLARAANDYLLRGHGAIPTGENVHDLNYLTAFAPGNPKGEDVRVALAAMRDFCRQRKILLLVCVMPDFSITIDGNYRWRPVHQKVDAWLRELSIPSIDLLPDFMGWKIEDYRVIGDGHPNAKAHRRIGELIVQALRQRHFTGN